MIRHEVLSGCPSTTTKERALATTSDESMTDWLLALLRYAVTRDDADNATMLAIAEAIDARGSHTEPSSFDFFRRTSGELCQAIGEDASPDRSAIIKRHLDRIEDDRLRRVFAAAVEIEVPQHVADSAKHRRPELWRGLG
jgi:hypothetical protein